MLYSGVILIHLQKNKGLERENSLLKRMIFSYFIIMTADAVWALAADGKFILLRSVDSMLSACIMIGTALGCFFWCCFIEVRLNPDFHLSRRNAVLFRIPITVLCIMDALSIWTGWMFHSAKLGNSEAGPLFFLQRVIAYGYLLIPMLHCFRRILNKNSKGKRREYLLYLATLAIQIAGAVLDEVLETTPVFALTVYMAIQLLFLTLYLDREYVMTRTDKELTESNMALMLSQIQPHFIYNSLAVIQDLCHDKAPEAEQTTFEFTRFLRGNIDSLNRTTPIPFTEELEHARYYLALESKRFTTEKIHVTYNITAQAFHLPALTLQPLVENAVQYSVGKGAEHVSVLIAAEETEQEFIVRIVDDGPGFDTGILRQGDGQNGSIRNVSSRLAHMCNGSLTVHSEPGHGTSVEIVVPKASGK